MIATALLEVEAYVARRGEERDDRGHAMVVRNGRARPRRVTVGSGTVPIAAPRVNDKRVVDGERQKFTSEILPPYLRRSPKVTEVLPARAVDGRLPGGAGIAAWRGRLGALGLRDHAADVGVAHGVPAVAQALARRPRLHLHLGRRRVYFHVRLEEDRLAALVVVGVRPDGTKELIAIEDGYRESTESWLTLLRDLKARGMRAPALSVGDGALGFWAAVGQVWPETREQRCWDFHDGKRVEREEKKENETKDGKAAA